MIVRIAIGAEEFEVDVTSDFLESVGELLARGVAERSTIEEILRQVQYVTRHSAELHARYQDRTAIFVDEEVVYAAGDWFEAQEWLSSEGPDRPYYAVQFVAGQEGPSGRVLDAGSLHGAGAH
jgi:hypothetical protein